MRFKDYQPSDHPTSKSSQEVLRALQHPPMEALEELERVQNRILQRIASLELSLLPQRFADTLSVSSPAQISDANGDTEARLSAILRANNVRDFAFKRVPFDYYDWPIEARRDILGAPSIHHLCKSIVLVRLISHFFFIFQLSNCINFNPFCPISSLYYRAWGILALRLYNLRIRDSKFPFIYSYTANLSFNI